MLLVCPKCKANYEVPRHAVPIGGREVKCADCGHSWFQTRTKKSNDDKLIEPQTEIKKGDTVKEVASAETNKKKIDPAVIKILKEEAKREIEARDRERSTKIVPSKNKKSSKNVRNSEPVTLTKEAIRKHQSKDAITEALEDKKTTKRSGFFFGLLIVLFALLAYTNGDQLVAFLPGSESYITSYIELIDEIRLELNKFAGKMTYLLTSLM